MAKLKIFINRHSFCCILSILCLFCFSSAASEYWLRELSYNAAVQAAEEAGYENYTIEVDENGDVYIYVLDPQPKSSDTKASGSPFENEREKAEDQDNSINKQDAFIIDEIQAYWTTSNNLFVPCVDFILRNGSQAIISEAIVDCVFIEKVSDSEYAREKYIAITTSDASLYPGQGRVVTIYSKNGKEDKTKNVPELTAEIYINGNRVQTIDIPKP